MFRLLFLLFLLEVIQKKELFHPTIKLMRLLKMDYKY